MCGPLPNLTGSCAHGANTIGGFGMVWPVFTIAYHVADLALNLPYKTFTNHYHRGLGRGIDVSVVGSMVGWASVVRVIAVDNGHTPSEVAHTIAVGIEKIF